VSFSSSRRSLKLEDPMGGNSLLPLSVGSLTDELFLEFSGRFALFGWRCSLFQVVVSICLDPEIRFPDLFLKIGTLVKNSQAFGSQSPSPFNLPGLLFFFF